MPLPHLDLHITLVIRSLEELNAQLKEIFGQWLDPTQSEPLWGPHPVCEEKGWYHEDVHRLQGAQQNLQKEPVPPTSN